jgi:hypothetical protein
VFQFKNVRINVSIVLLMFSFICIISAYAETESFENESITKAILTTVPSTWKLVETKKNEIPYGHYWGYEYDGQKGELLIFMGPKNVMLNWRDTKSNCHQVPLAKESLSLWIMPPDYHESWKRFFYPHRPIPPELIYSGNVCRVYGLPSSRITSDEEFNKILKQATEICWSDSPDPDVAYKNKGLSWTTWSADLERQLKAILK